MAAEPSQADVSARFAELEDQEAESGVPSGALRFSRGDHVEMGQRLAASLGDVIHSEGHLYKYSAGRWAPVIAGSSEKIAQSYAGALVGSGRRMVRRNMKSSDVSGTVREAERAVTDPDFFAAAPRGVPFQDQFVAIDGAGKIVTQPISRNHRARWGVAAAYVPGALPEALLFSLREMFVSPLLEGDPVVEQEALDKIQVIQEFFGACLVGVATRYARYLVLLGDGANGKSKLAELMAEIFPAGSTTSIPIQQLGQEYRVALLAGKLLNVVGELPERDILESEVIKAVVTGDQVQGRHIRQAPFDFKPVAGHCFNAQRMPAVVDFSHGFWRRPMILNFPVAFENEPLPTQRQRDPTRIDAWLAERAKVMSWLIDGAARLVARGKFAEPAASIKAVADWREGTDVIGSFAKEFFSQHGLGDPKDVYRLYRVWCDDSGHRPLALPKLMQRMVEFERKGQQKPKQRTEQKTEGPKF